MGRFFTQDPFGGNAAYPASLNPYTYGYNNPVRYTDPSGECADPATFFFICLPALLALTAAGADLYYQLDQHNGNWDCVDWGEVAMYGGGAAVVALTVPSAIAALVVLDSYVDFAYLVHHVSTGDYAAARWDAASLLLPGIVGLGILLDASKAYRAINTVDNFTDAGRALNTIGNVPGAAHYVNSTNSYYGLSRIIDNTGRSTFDPGKLDRILVNLQKEGVDVYNMGVEARQHLTEAGVEAMYRLRSGGRPGILILPDNPSNSAVIEELIHLGQDRNSGWTLYNQMRMSKNPIFLRLELEIDAKEKLLVIGKRLSFPQVEMDRTYEILVKYRKALREARGY